MNFVFRALTEIDFLSRQTMVFDTGSRTTSGTLATITPADGLTFVLLGAHVAAHSVASTGGPAYLVELRNEANVRDILAGASSNSGGSSGGNSISPDFSLVKGDILEGDGIKIYTLEVTGVSGLTVVGSLYGYLRNT